MLPHKPHRRASREITLDSWNLIRAGGGLASAAAGILLLVGHVLNLGGDPVYGTVPGASSVLTAHVLLASPSSRYTQPRPSGAASLGSWGWCSVWRARRSSRASFWSRWPGLPTRTWKPCSESASRARLPFWLALRSSSDSSCSARLRCGLACSHDGPDSS